MVPFAAYGDQSVKWAFRPGAVSNVKASPHDKRFHRICGYPMDHVELSRK